jgi:hypothetical protein
MAGSMDTARFDTSVPHSHDRLDRKDQRTHANTVEEATRVRALYVRKYAEQLNLTLQAEKEGQDNSATVTDPLQPAQSHGHEPSRGAKIDKQIQDEEEEELRNKGKI